MGKLKDYMLKRTWEDIVRTTWMGKGEQRASLVKDYTFIHF